MQCFKCESHLNNDDNNVQCDGCKRHICLQCSNLTSSEARVMGLKGKRTLLYLCDLCREALFQMPKLIKSYDGLKAEVEEIKVLLKTRNGMQDTNPVLVSGDQDGSSVVSPSVPLSSPRSSPASVPNTNSIVEELLERERRACNLILVGVKESAADDGKARKSFDGKCVHKILHDVHGGVFDEKVVSVQRLGRREVGKQRPIKVVLKSRQDALCILKNKSKANREVMTYDDKTPEQTEDTTCQIT